MNTQPQEHMHLASPHKVSAIRPKRKWQRRNPSLPLSTLLSSNVARIITRLDSILRANRTITAMDVQFTTTSVAEIATRCGDRFSLSIV